MSAKSAKYRLRRNVTVDGKTWARGQQIFVDDDNLSAFKGYPTELYPWLEMYELNGRALYPPIPYKVPKEKRKDDN